MGAALGADPHLEAMLHMHKAKAEQPVFSSPLVYRDPGPPVRGKWQGLPQRSLRLHRGLAQGL